MKGKARAGEEAEEDDRRAERRPLLPRDNKAPWPQAAAGAGAGEVGSTSGRPHLVNLGIISSGFFCIFFAFGTTQLLESSLIPGRLGYWCLASLYATMCVSSLFIASPMTKFLRERKALVVGAATYVVFVAANLRPGWLTLIPGAMVLGVGAGVLWTAAGSYLTAAGANYATAKGKPLKSEMGLFNGILSAARNLASVVGNIVASLILIFGDRLGGEAMAIQVLFFSFTGVGAAGVLIMLLLGEEKAMEKKKEVSQQPNPRTTSVGKRRYMGIGKFDDADFELQERGRIEDDGKNDRETQDEVVFNWDLFTKKAKDSAALHRDPRLTLLIPLFFYNGYEQAFATGDFAKEVIKEYLDLSAIGFIFAWYSLVLSVCSAFLGHLSDRWGRRLFLVIGVACHLPFYLFFGLLWPSRYVPEGVISDNPLSVVVAITLLAIGDCCFSTLPPILMSVFFTDNTEPAFANFKFYQSLGSVFGFILGPLITFPLKIALLSTGILIASFFMLLLDQRYASLNTI